MVILPSIRRKYMASRIPWGATVPMSGCVVTLASDSMSYTGQARTVGVTVTWEGSTLEVNTDYTLSYANNVNIGPATVTVTGMGQFSGSVTRTFYIRAGAAGWQDFDLASTSFLTSAALSDGSQITDVVHAQILADGRLFFTDKHTQRMYVWGWNEGVGPAVSYDSRSDVTNYTWGAVMARNGLSLVRAGGGFGHTFANTLTTAFDLSTIGGGNSQQVFSAVYPVLCLSHGGDYLVAKASSGNELHAYSLGTAFDYSSADSFADVQMTNKEPDIIAATGESSGTWYGLSFSGDGLYAVAVWGKCVLKLALSVPWDVSTCTLSSFFKPSQGTTWSAVAVSPSGERMFLFNTTDGKFYEYSLSA